MQVVIFCLFFFGRDKYTFYYYLYRMYQVLNMYIDGEARTKFNRCSTQMSTSIFNYRQLPYIIISNSNVLKIKSRTLLSKPKRICIQ